MDGTQLFKLLGAGAKFNFRKFESDAKKLNIKSSNSGCANNNDNNHLENQPLYTIDESNRISNKRKCDDDDDNNLSNDELNADQGQELVLLGNIKSGTGIASSKKKKKKSKSKKEKLLLAHTEQVNHIRKKNNINVTGMDVPDPVQTFDQLVNDYGMNAKILENLQSFGYKAPTSIQMQAIPAIMHQREILACAPTGSGKTAAFLLPVLHQLNGPKKDGVRALIICPTRELARQIFLECERLSDGTGLFCHVIEKAKLTAKKYGKNGCKKLDILITTPNKLIYLLKEDPPVLNLNSVEWLIVDESDKLFEEGKRGFREQLAAIYQACDGKQVKRALFSATFAHDVEEWCLLNLDNVLQVYIGTRNTAVQTVSQELVFVGNEQGKLVAMQNIIKKELKPPVLIFVQSKERAKELFQELIYDGINVDVIHADRTQLQRDNIIRCFRSGQIWVLICTELMGRGIDFKGVNLVINYDFPATGVAYIHRIGRTGRAGNSGKAITFFTEEDAANLRSIANIMKQAGCHVPDYMLRLKKPDRNKRRKLMKTEVRRKPISTDLYKKRRKIKTKKIGQKDKDMKKT